MRNHYVPQFLLRAWSSGDEEDVVVFRNTQQGVRASRRGTKFTGFEHDMLSLTRDVIAGMDKHAIEKQFLRVVDQEASDAREKMLQGGLAALSPYDRVAWARFIMSLRLRQPSLVMELRDSAAKHLRASLASHPAEYTEIAGEAAPVALEEWTEQKFPGLIENFGLSFFAGLVDDATIGTKLMNLKWWLWDFSDCDIDLLLADHPCIFASGIDAPKLIVALPISPKMAFLATRGEDVATALRATKPRDLLKRINTSSVIQATVRVYARDERPLRLVQNNWRLRPAR